MRWKGGQACLVWRVNRGQREQGREGTGKGGTEGGTEAGREEWARESE